MAGSSCKWGAEAECGSQTLYVALADWTGDRHKKCWNAINMKHLDVRGIDLKAKFEESRSLQGQQIVISPCNQKNRIFLAIQHTSEGYVLLHLYGQLTTIQLVDSLQQALSKIQEVQTLRHSSELKSSR